MKNIKSVSLSNEGIAIIEAYLKDYGEFSKWVEEQLFKSFLSEQEILEEKQKKMEQELKKIKDQLIIINNSDKKSHKEEHVFMKSAKTRLAKDYSFLDGIVKQYNNLFQRRISKDYFKKRMREILNNKGKNNK